MDLIKLVLFESPAHLLVGTVLLLAVLGSCWFFRPGKVTSWLVVGAMLLGSVLLIVQHIVVTDRERIGRIIDELALAVDCEDVQVITDAMADDCRVDRMDKDELTDRLRTFFERAEIDDVKIIGTEIETDGDTASAFVKGHCRVTGTEYPYEHHPSSWSIEFERRGGTWLIHRIRHVAQQGLTAGDLLNFAIK